MQFEERSVSISAIDLADETYSLGVHAETASLAESINTFGLLNPPIVRARDEGGYRVVCGFRRAAACMSLGWQQTPVRVLAGEIAEFEVLRLVILDNRSHRELTIVEQARAVKKLEKYVSRDNRFEVLPPLLGLPRNEAVFRRIAAVAGLPAALQDAVGSGVLSLEAAADLSKFSSTEAVAFLQLFSELKLSQNKQREIVRFAGEIALREGVDIAAVLGAGQVQEIMGAPELNRNEKGARLRRYLAGRRYPSIRQVENRAAQALDDLKLDKTLFINTPPFFESPEYTLTMRFTSLEEFEKGVRRVKEIAGNPALRRLLEPFTPS